MTPADIGVSWPVFWSSIAVPTLLGLWGIIRWTVEQSDARHASSLPLNEHLARVMQDRVLLTADQRALIDRLSNSLQAANDAVRQLRDRLIQAENTITELVDAAVQAREQVHALQRVAGVEVTVFPPLPHRHTPS